MPNELLGNETEESHLSVATISAVEAAVKTAISSSTMVCWDLEKILGYMLKNVAAKLADKSPTEIRPPDMAAVGPAIINMAFAANAPHLREMYSNLLARAMHATSAEKVHPSFAQTIQQLSPQEARILKEIANSVLSKGAIFEQEEDPNRVRPDPPILQQWKSFCSNCGIKDEVLATAYLNNLVRLGILAETAASRTASMPSAIGSRLVTARRLVLTAYGTLFLDVCVRDENRVS